MDLNSFLIVGGIIGGVMAIILAIIVYTLASSALSQAKKVAKEILAKGEVKNLHRFERVAKILAANPNDLESKHLWERLQALSEQTSK